MGIEPLGTGEGLDRLLGLPGSSSFRSVAWFTLWQAAVSTTLTVLLALPGAHLLARFRYCLRLPAGCSSSSKALGNHVLL